MELWRTAASCQRFACLLQESIVVSPPRRFSCPSGLADYWAEDFDWKKQVAILNEMPQFTTQLNGNTVHFVHKRSTRPDAVPLLIVHGWPGSFWECHKAIPLYTEPENSQSPAFHVVCPSIPGYGFSSKPTARGFDQQAAAELFAALMETLGYDEYMLQVRLGCFISCDYLFNPPFAGWGLGFGCHLVDGRCPRSSVARNRSSP